MELYKARFSEAFASRPRPTATQILRPGVTADEGDHLRALLAAKTEQALSTHEIQTVVENNLWMLAPEAFLYFLPALLDAALSSYGHVSVFASELVGTLTEPSRADVVETFDQLSQSAPGLPAEMLDLLRKQQLELADSGIQEAMFHERFDRLTPRRRRSDSRISRCLPGSSRRELSVRRAADRHRPALEPVSSFLKVGASKASAGTSALAYATALPDNEVGEIA